MVSQWTAWHIAQVFGDRNKTTRLTKAEPPLGVMYQTYLILLRSPLRLAMNVEGEFGSWSCDGEQACRIRPWKPLEFEAD